MDADFSFNRQTPSVRHFMKARYQTSCTNNVGHPNVPPNSLVGKKYVFQGGKRKTYS